MTKRTKKDDTSRWIPVRHGKVYCSPACGARCTMAAFNAATATAHKICARLGPGWQPRVWENMGWFCEATRGGAKVRKRAHRDFSAEIQCGVMHGPHPGAHSTVLQFWGDGTTPRHAVDAAMSSAREVALNIAAALVEVGP